MHLHIQFLLVANISWSHVQISLFLLLLFSAFSWPVAPDPAPCSCHSYPPTLVSLSPVPSPNTSKLFVLNRICVDSVSLTVWCIFNVAGNVGAGSAWALWRTVLLSLSVFIPAHTFCALCFIY
jgi:hypothetical protein